jgi:hypothetical protein
LKARVLLAVAALAMAFGTPPIVLDTLGSLDPPLIEMHTFVQHINILTS